jgi:transcription-repair coupling factor (superfamily II helicase)
MLQLPDWETLPYDNFSPHQDIVSERLRSLHRLPRAQRGVLIVPMSALLQRLPRGHYIEANSLSCCAGVSSWTSTPCASRSRAAAIAAWPTVYEHGEFAVRGSLIDIYPMGSDLPLRIDLLDDEIDSLRCFDPGDTAHPAPRRQHRTAPGAGVPPRSGGHPAFPAELVRALRRRPRPVPGVHGNQRRPRTGGAEYYLPLFFEHCETLLDYLPRQRRWSPSADHYGAAQRFFAEATRRYDEFNIDPRRPLLTPAEVFTPGRDAVFGHEAFRRTRTAPAPRFAGARGHAIAAPAPARQRHESNLELRRGSTASSRVTRARSCSAPNPRAPRDPPREPAARRRNSTAGGTSWTPARRLHSPSRRSIAAWPSAPTHQCWSRRHSCSGNGWRSDGGASTATRSIRKPFSATSTNCGPAHRWSTAGAWRGPLPRADASRGGRRSGGIPDPRVRGGASKLYVPVASLQLISRYSGSDPGAGAAAPAGLRAVGEGAAQGA